MQDQLESTQRKIDTLEAEEATLIRRRDSVRYLSSLHSPARDLRVLSCG